MANVEAGRIPQSKEPKKKVLMKNVVVPAALVASAAGLAFAINDRINWPNELNSELKSAGIYEPSDKQVKEATEVLDAFDKKFGAFADKKDFGAAGEAYSSVNNDKGLAKAQEILKSDSVYDAEWSRLANDKYATRASVDAMTLFVSSAILLGAIPVDRFVRKSKKNTGE